jgi:hypothetical protein
MTTISDRWCIVQTAPQRTLAVARSLADAGHGAWTPTGAISKRRPRSDERQEVAVPIAPTFVFLPVPDDKRGQEMRIAEIAGLAKNPRSPHPQFSLFRLAGRIPIIGASSLSGLRVHEEIEQLKAKQRVERARVLAEMEADKAALAIKRAQASRYAAGDRVLIAEAGHAYTGAVGLVQTVRGHEAIVAFGGMCVWKVETWLLAPADVKTLQAA